jgi:hypothetical protein
LSALQKYLEVLDEDLESAISTLKFWDVQRWYSLACHSGNIGTQWLRIFAALP